jgi:hypothetical protein
MKLFFNAVALGAALVAGITSVFQNVPFLVFAKRIGLTCAAFYLIGLALNVLWNAASSYIGFSERGKGTGDSGEKP